jgi:hypothetical protein
MELYLHSTHAFISWRGTTLILLYQNTKFVWGKREVHTAFWWGDPREGDHLGDPGVDGRIILIRIFGRWDWGMD